MHRHHRKTRRYVGCSATALTAEDSDELLNRFLENLNEKIALDEASRVDLPHGVLAAPMDGGAPSVYGPFNDSHEAADFARQLELRLGENDDVHFVVIPLDSPE